VGQEWFYIQDGRQNIQPEQSESWSAGVILTPRFLPGMRVSVDYTKIRKVNEIQTPSIQFIVENETAFPDRIVRGANLPGDPAGWAGPIVSLDGTLINIAKTSLEAFDVQADYMLDTQRHGQFRWYALATFQPHYRNQILPTSAVVDRVGFTNGPLKLRGNMGVDWSKGRWTVGWNSQYYDSYLIYTALALPLSSSQANARATSILNQGSDTVPNQIYHDLVTTYQFASGQGFLGGLLADAEISCGIQNIFDKSPPILASTSPIAAGYSTYGDPRLRRYSLSFRKSFGQ
jgi:outer membrane receptor protein involved in Fe transport